MIHRPGDAAYLPLQRTWVGKLDPAQAAVVRESLNLPSPRYARDQSLFPARCWQDVTDLLVSLPAHPPRVSCLLLHWFYGFGTLILGIKGIHCDWRENVLRCAEAEVSDWLTRSKRAGMGECQHGACSGARETDARCLGFSKQSTTPSPPCGVKISGNC